MKIINKKRHDLNRVFNETNKFMSDEKEQNNDNHDFDKLQKIIHQMLNIIVDININIGIFQKNIQI